MVNYFIYATEYSYLTDGNKYFHEHALPTVELFKSEVETLSGSKERRVVYLHWGQECVEVDEETTVDDYKSQKGNGENTLPETIIKWIKDNISEDHKIKVLYIITNGEMHEAIASLSRCLRLNVDVNYEKVCFRAINRTLRNIDQSVPIAFFKSHCVFYCNDKIYDRTEISQEFYYNTITIDNFSTKKENLKSYIKSKYFNKSKRDATALIEIKQLGKLRYRLLNSLTSASGSVNLETKNKNTFLQAFKETNWYKSLSSPSYDLKKDIDKSISTLINNIVCKKKCRDFDSFRYKIKFGVKVPEEKLPDVSFSTEQEIEFPDIILGDEKGIPVVIFTQPILFDMYFFKSESGKLLPYSFSKFRSTMECSLFLLNDPKFNDSVGYFYTLKVFKELLEKPVWTEPRTLRPFVGGIVLVDTDDFDAYNDYIISATYFFCNRVNVNIGLFYFMLWKICEKKEWMDRNVVEQFKKYMLRRVETTVCKIGLSSLPLDPQVKTSLPTALWYCVELSSDIFKSDPEHFAYERLRMYHEVSHYMIEILQYLNYDLDLEYIRRRQDLIKLVMILKKIPKRRDKVFYLVEKIFKNVNGFLVSEIENQDNVKKLNYLKLYHKGMLSDEVISEDININDYVYFSHHVDDSGVQICETTFYPYFMINENIRKDKTFYNDLSEIGKQIVVEKVDDELVLHDEAIDEFERSTILAYFKLFILCIEDAKKFHTLEEYSNYILKKEKFKEDFVTIFPVDVVESIERMFLSFQNLIKNVSTSELVAVCKKYVSRVEREIAESKFSI